MSPIDPQETVREIAVRVPFAARVFEAHHIDYCCHGGVSLREACSGGLSVETIAREIEAAEASTSKGTSWADVPTAALIRHLLDTHHVFTRTELGRLRPLIAKVVGKHGASHPELTKISELFGALDADLTPHLAKEEQILFPMMQQNADACGPIAVMEEEHEEVGKLLRELRSVTRDYTPPDDACTSFRVLYAGLAALEADLHQHIHLENNVLFARAEG